MELLSPHLNQIIYSVVAFFVLLFVLSRIAFPPIIEMLQKRSDTIRESLEAAERTREEAQALLDDYKQQLAKAREEAQQIIEQGRKFGETMKQEIVEKAKQQADHVMARATAEMDRQRDLAVAELQKQVADLTIGAASRVIQKSLSKEEHLALIEEYLTEAGQASEN